jgi:hypothetical protein
MGKAPKVSNGNSDGHAGAVEQIVMQVKTGLLSTIATGIVTALVATLLTVWTLVQKWPGKIGLTPPDAVMAFDLKEGCPTGWSPYPQAWGRFVMGAVETKDDIGRIPGKFSRDARGVELTPKPFGIPGGEEEHVVKPEELPDIEPKITYNDGKIHTSELFWSSVLPVGGNNVMISALTAGTSPSSTVQLKTNIDSLGKGKAGNNISPYISLYFCKKD